MIRGKGGEKICTLKMLSSKEGPIKFTNTVNYRIYAFISVYITTVLQANELDLAMVTQIMKIPLL